MASVFTRLKNLELTEEITKQHVLWITYKQSTMQLIIVHQFKTWTVL